MFQDNLKRLRQKQGYSQAELAQQLHVVRQTVSKWERGLSVPDAQMLIELADILEVSVEELLGAPIEEEGKQEESKHESSKNASENERDIANALARLNDQLAMQNERRQKIWTMVKRVFLAAIILWIVLIIMNVAFTYSIDDKEQSATVSPEVGIEDIVGTSGGLTSQSQVRGSPRMIQFATQRRGS